MKYWLVIGLLYPGQQPWWTKGEFDTAAECMAMLKASEVQLPPSPKGQPTWVGFKTCVPMRKK